jgi:hypothetical protein
MMKTTPFIVSPSLLHVCASSEIATIAVNILNGLVQRQYDLNLYVGDISQLNTSKLRYFFSTFKSWRIIIVQFLLDVVHGFPRIPG